ncbi:transposase [Streptomyces sp. NPDC001118]
MRTLNRMEFVGETPRAALEALAAAAPGWLTGLTDSSWAERYGVRNEGTISQAVRRTRLRRTPYQGQAKTHLANVLSATAINLVRVDA